MRTAQGDGVPQVGGAKVQFSDPFRNLDGRDERALVH